MKKNTGLSLVAMLVAMLLGVIVLGGVISMYISTVNSSKDVVDSARLNHDLDSIMQLMVNDIRRAGYWGGAVTNVDIRDNPFIQVTPLNNITNIHMPVNTCILYTYDADGDGFVNNGEYYGFKLDGNEIKVSSANSVDATVGCSENDGRWEVVSASNKVSITLLTFSDGNYKCLNVSTRESYDTTCAVAAVTDDDGDGAKNLITGEAAVEIRQIDISLEGFVVNDASAEKKLSGVVKVRNNRVFVQP